MNIAIVNHRVLADGKLVAQRPTPNRGGALDPQGIVLHDTAGDLGNEGAVSWLTNPAARASAHVVVGRDGTIIQLAPFNVVTWHAGKSNWKGRQNVNSFAVGIEIVNPGKLARIGEGLYANDLRVRVREDDDHIVRAASTPAHGSGYWLDYTAAQIEAVIALCVALREFYGIEWIATHWLISPGRKIDTNAIFPLDRVRAAVFGGRTLEDKTSPSPETDNDGLVSVNALNLRSGPGMGSEVIASLDRGTRVVVRESDHVGATRWLLVDVPVKSKSGWVAARYIDLD